jgi:hypothetical protein
MIERPTLYTENMWNEISCILTIHRMKLCTLAEYAKLCKSSIRVFTVFCGIRGMKFNICILKLCGMNLYVYCHYAE